MSNAPDQQSAPGKPDQSGSTLEVTVLSPRHPDPVPFSFPNAMTVGEAAQIVADAFGYASPSAFIAMFKQVTGRSPQRYLDDA